VLQAPCGRRFGLTLARYMPSRPTTPKGDSSRRRRYHGVI
jgi:hypothetical protein